jgi:hypothetical protein
MKKTFQLTQEGKNRDRVVEAVKNEVRKYQQREQRKALPEGVDYWDFDCKVGATADTAQALHVAELTAAMNAVVAAQSATLYVELLAKPGVRTARPRAETGAEPDSDFE